MRDFFFQIVLFLAALIAGVTVPLWQRDQQKRLAWGLGLVLGAVAMLWTGVEIGSRNVQSQVAVGSVAPVTTSASLQSTVISNASSSASSTVLGNDVLQLSDAPQPPVSEIPKSITSSVSQPTDAPTPSESPQPTDAPAPSVSSISTPSTTNSTGIQPTPVISMPFSKTQECVKGLGCGFDFPAQVYEMAIVEVTNAAEVELFFNNTSEVRLWYDTDGDGDLEEEDALNPQQLYLDVKPNTLFRVEATHSFVFFGWIRNDVANTSITVAYRPNPVPDS